MAPVLCGTDIMPFQLWCPMLDDETPRLSADESDARPRPHVAAWMASPKSERRCDGRCDGRPVGMPESSLMAVWDECTLTASSAPSVGTSRHAPSPMLLHTALLRLLPLLMVMFGVCDIDVNSGDTRSKAPGWAMDSGATLLRRESLWMYTDTLEWFDAAPAAVAVVVGGVVVVVDKAACGPDGAGDVLAKARSVWTLEKSGVTAPLTLGLVMSDCWRGRDFCNAPRFPLDLGVAACARALAVS